jgi:hypothetical protein
MSEVTNEYLKNGLDLIFTVRVWYVSNCLWCDHGKSTRDLQSTTSLYSIDSFQQSIPQSDITIYNHNFIDTIKGLK